MTNCPVEAFVIRTLVRDRIGAIDEFNSLRGKETEVNLFLSLTDTLAPLSSPALVCWLRILLDPPSLLTNLLPEMLSLLASFTEDDLKPSSSKLVVVGDPSLRELLIPLVAMAFTNRQTEPQSKPPKIQLLLHNRCICKIA